MLTEIHICFSEHLLHVNSSAFVHASFIINIESRLVGSSFFVSSRMVTECFIASVYRFEEMKRGSTLEQRIPRVAINLRLKVTGKL